MYGYGEPVRLCNKCNGMCFRGDLLLNAVSLNDMQTVQKLVDEGCDVNFTTSIFPPLTIAANRGFSDVVRLLIRNSAEVNHFVSSGDTNLIMQCQQCGRTSAVSASNAPPSPTSWTRPTTASSYNPNPYTTPTPTIKISFCPLLNSAVAATAAAAACRT
jgi:ankyrin repeat protein